MRYCFSIIVVLFFVVDTQAQCAMCKAVAEANLAEGENNIGQGINDGILYLMAAPYIMLFSLGFWFFKKSIIAKWKTLIG